MSCTIDQTSLISSRNGSVLMEFVLVLPIYILLLGILFLLGDMGLNAVRIATGDRDLAMDAGDRSGQSMSMFLLNQMREEAFKVLPDSSTYRTNENFNGSWSWQTAGRASFAYKLPSWGGGLVSFPYLHYGDVTSYSGALGTLVGGGRVIFHSKDYSFGVGVRSYNYYTLKRTDLARDPNAYRNWDSWDSNGGQSTSRSRLTQSANGLKQHWYASVCDEAYADSSPDSLDSFGRRQGRDALPNRPSGRKEYKRLDVLVPWSQ